MSAQEFNPVAGVLPYVRLHARRADPGSVLAALDQYGWNESWMMFIGPHKGLHLDRVVDGLPEKARILELG
jgi:hypothetical protein